MCHCRYRIDCSFAHFGFWTVLRFQHCFLYLLELNFKGNAIEFAIKCKKYMVVLNHFVFELLLISAADLHISQSDQLYYFKKMKMRTIYSKIIFTKGTTVYLASF